MLYESIVSIKNGQSGVGVLFTMGFVYLPDFVRNEEIVSFYFSLEGEFRNTIVSISGTEIIVIFRVFV